MKKKGTKNTRFISLVIAERLIVGNVDLRMH